MSFPTSLNRPAMLLLAATAGAVATPAMASPAHGVSATPVVVGTLDRGVRTTNDAKLLTNAPMAIGMQELTFQANSSTGWHHHPGLVIVTVKSGLLHLQHFDCSRHDYAAGASFAVDEHSAHEATSDDLTVIDVTYIAPNPDNPKFRLENDPPFCATSFDGLAKKP